MDSELMLLWWDAYPKHKWAANPLSWRVQTHPQLRRQVPAWAWKTNVLMVARIDGPTPDVARRLINQALDAEEKGIQGNVYLDARGTLENPGHGSYDQNLRNLADRLKNQTRFNVMLDDQAQLFSAGQCPRTMLYCGWYSLRNYIPAFDFVSGAVGYHIASFEAISLKNPLERGWCKGLLQDGITATIEPVAEPYLQSFPPPQDFFGFLLTGQFTLVECYAYTTTFTSWIQMLIGAPLYRPFANNPPMSLEQACPLDLVPQRFRPATTSATTASAPP